MFTPNKFKTSEYQKYLNAYEIFSKEEIKTLKKLNPDKIICSKFLHK